METSTGNFTDYLAGELERLNHEREELIGQRRTIDEKLTEIERELVAIDAYQTTKSGSLVPTTSRGRPSSRSVKKASIHGRRGSKRETLLNLIRQNPDGMRRGDILMKMGLKGDKSGEMSVSNALTAMIKSKQLERDAGKYKAI